MKILLLQEWFDPEPMLKGLSFAKGLKALGHEVQVLTAFPNFPGGKVYEGYNIKFFQKEILDGIPIIRVPLYPSHDRSGLKRFFTYASFAFSASTIGLALLKPVHLIYVVHAPPSAILAALAHKLFSSVPFIYDIQDLWPDSLPATGMLQRAWILKLVNVWCNFIYKAARHLIVQSHGMKERLIKRGVPSDKITVVHNWADEASDSSFSEKDNLAQKLGFINKFNVVFAGTLGKAQGLEAVLQAAKILQIHSPQIQFVFVGNGIEEENLKTYANVCNLKNVKFLPRVPFSEIGKILNLADVLLVHLKNDPLFEITIPSKTQAYLSVGRPILMAVPGESADLIKRAGAGFVCKSEDAEAIAKSVETMSKMSTQDLKQMGENGKKFYRNQLSQSAGLNATQQVLTKISIS